MTSTNMTIWHTKHDEVCICIYV